MLPEPVARQPLHTRTLTFRGYARADGLWDMEGELHDSKHYAYERSSGDFMQPGTAIHHMHIRATVDETLCIREIHTSMQATPFGECTSADATLQRMVGQRMGPGWRQAIDRAVGGVQGCTHLRELLFNLATAALQTIPHHQSMQRLSAGESRHQGDEPPFYMGRCMTWDFNGPVVARVAPQFIGWVKKPTPVKPA